MKDIPALFIFLVVFVVGFLGVFFYSTNKPASVIPSQNIWNAIELVQQNIRDRSLEINEGESFDQKFHGVYSISVKRLNNILFKGSAWARYTAKIDALVPLPAEASFASDGLQIGVIDKNPLGYTGDVGLVALIKLGTQPQ
ncbi:MAG: hypothetical protein KDD48_01265 [Bdellovibrionales bacterium]|nr:hypothetical protein [Bdellovibrionales bacterium]